MSGLRELAGADTSLSSGEGNVMGADATNLAWQIRHLGALSSTFWSESLSIRKSLGRSASYSFLSHLEAEPGNTSNCQGSRG